MTTQRTKRQLSAWVLLAVMLPMMLLSALHRHEQAADAEGLCVECVNHQPHAGHLTVQDFSLHECVLCQFLSFTYIAAASAVVIIALRSTVVSRCLRPCVLRAGVGDVRSARAPPFCFV